MNKNIILLIASLFFSTSLMAQSGEWTWIHGPQAANNNTGNYGTIGVEAPTNLPPARYQAAYWTDKNGDFWVFGGYNHSTGEHYNDMWKFKPSTEQWTWIHGPQYSNNTLGNSGTQGVSSPLNIPQARGWGANCWTGDDGHLYLYGGSNLGSTLNDLWRFDISTEEWTWINGNASGTNVMANFGVKGVAAATNDPGGRQECKSSFVLNGELWMFGGQTISPSIGELNDLWKYDPQTNLWTWMSGSNVAGSMGNYGSLGVPSTTNEPPSRWSYTKWNDADGNLYIFAGGQQIDIRNDVWKYNTNTNEWTWINGSSTSGDLGSVTNLCESNGTNSPRSRIENQTAQTFSTCASAFWTFGGFTGSGTQSFNDLWIYNSEINEWVMVWGNTSQMQVPQNYGTIGVSSSTNAIPARGGLCIWTDKDENLWVFGGADFGAIGGFVLYNDMWKFTPDTTCFNIILANSNFSWPSDQEICEGEEFEMSFPPNTVVQVTPSNGATYDAATGRLVLNPSITTTFTINASTPAGSPCPLDEQQDITITIKPKPQAIFNLTPDSAPLSDPTLYTANNSIDADNYYWYDAGNLISTDFNTSITKDAPDTYCLQLVAENECGLDTASDCAEIGGILVIPNAFTPNGDDKNNVFKIIANYDIRLQRFVIYNRWGEQIFETNDQNMGWDGMYKGVLAEIGTYFYLVELDKSLAGKTTYRGDLTLLR